MREFPGLFDTGFHDPREFERGYLGKMLHARTKDQMFPGRLATKLPHAWDKGGGHYTKSCAHKDRG